VRIAFVLLALLCLGTLTAEAQVTADSDQLVNYETLYLLFNVNRPPFDDVHVRYALAMATDRRALTAVMAAGSSQNYVAGVGLLPPYAGYPPIDHVEVTVDGETYDVVSFNPSAARQLFAKAKRGTSAGRLEVEVLAHEDEETAVLTRELAKMWKDNLGIDVRITLKPWHAALKSAAAFDFNGLALEGRSTLRSQPDSLLFAPMFLLEKAGWTDREIMKTLDRIGSERNYARAAAKLRMTEERLLKQMPLIPLFSRTP
jgi:oligopeptide transport system substrate-binding protein